MAISSTAKIQGDFTGKDIITIDQFTPPDLEILFKHATAMKDIAENAKPSDLLKGNIVALIFFEPSTRTFNSFAAAVKQLGGQTIENQSPQQNSSVAKGETLEDTIQVLEAYSDAIVMRHNIAGSAQTAAHAAAFVPIINAGDGGASHPTQTLLDLYTIQEKFGSLNNLKVVMAGDVLHSRTIKSLIEGLCLFKKNTIYLLSPKQLKLSREDYAKYSKKAKIVEIVSAQDIPKDAQVWYWNRIQKERFTPEELAKVQGILTVDKKLLNTYANKDTILMDPLPRIGTILPEVDSDPRAVYLRTQVRNGMYTRMALFTLILGKLS